MLLSGLSVCYTAAEIARKEGNKIILPQTISYHSWRQPLEFLEFMGVQIILPKQVLGSTTAY